MDTVPALSQHVDLIVLRQELDIHAIADLLPWLIRQCLLVTAQSSFGCSHQVVNRRVAAAHFFENLFRRNPTVHHPYALGFPVLLLDLFQEPLQGRIVGGVARHDLIRQWKSFRGYDQRNDHLHAIEPLVPAVAVLPLVVLRERRIALEVRAGQIIKENVELRVEQIFPTLRQVIKERSLMFNQPVQALVEFMDLHQFKARPQKIGHRACLVPIPMKPPFAPGIDQTVTAKRLNN